ncbi:MAG TPA: polyprenol monophosphomannose synthase [Polyangiaceae bacterium]|nr:polyprenol monophosphomannose synthase [Polyangiaceae bacterium]
MRVIAVVPTYNEAENLPLLVAALLALPLDLRVLVVDDASPDGTGAVADGLSAKNPGRVEVIHRTGARGLRGAYFEGFRRAFTQECDAIAQMDADLSHDPERLPAMVEALSNADVVLGSRYVAGGSVDHRWPIWRKGLSAWGNFYARSILGLRMRDMTTGYRLWRREALLKMPLEQILSNGYIFLVEMVFLAKQQGLRIAEVPIHFNDRRLGQSKMSLKIQLEAAGRIWQVRFAHRDK